MEITLEKIELVKDRTGVTYKEAKDALEAADGSVVDAIINIEDNIDNRDKKNVGEQGAAVVEAIGDAVKKGNVSKIVVKNKDGEVLLNIPVNAGIIGAVIAPWGVLAGIIASFGFKCIVEIVKDDGTIVDVSERVTEKINKGVEKGSEIAGQVKSKGAQVYEDVRSGDAIDKAADLRDKAADLAAGAKDKFGGKAEDIVDEVKEKAEDAAEEAKDAVDEVKDKAEDIADDIKDKFDK
jgi:Transcription factor homologous to NACalpha-BTF3